MARAFEIRFTHPTGNAGSPEEAECEATAEVVIHRDGSLVAVPDVCPECGDHLGPTIQESLVAKARSELYDLLDWERTCGGSLI